MSGDPPPSFTLVTSKKRASKAVKSAEGMAEGQSLGKVKSSGLEPLDGPSSRPEISGRNPGTGSLGKVAESLGPLAPAVMVGGDVGGAEGTGRRAARHIDWFWETSGETRPTGGCHKCHKPCPYRANCPERTKPRSRPKEGMKRKLSGATGQTPEGKQAKQEESALAEATKYRKTDFDWSQVTLIVLKTDGQPMSLEEYEEEKGNFILKELELAEKDGSMIDIDEWNWFQDRVEVKFSNVASTEIFMKLMGNRNIISKVKWEDEHLKLHYFTGKIDKATMKLRFKGLRFMVET